MSRDIWRLESDADTRSVPPVTRGWSHWLPAWVLAFTLCGLPSLTYADEPRPVESSPSNPSQTEALGHYERGREHFRAGRYGEAIIELKAALALDPSSANLLYNVAYTSELLGDLRGAIDYYRKELAALPDSEAAEREKVMLTLRRLEGRLAERPVVAPPPPKPPARQFGRADLLFWSSLGGGVALLAGGAVTGVLALAREHEVKNFVAGKDGTLAQRNSLIDQTHMLALSSDILTGAGAALVVTAALLFFLREPKVEQPNAETAPHASLATDGRSVRMTLSAQF